MDIVKYSDINFNNLSKLDNQGSNSIVYKDGNQCIKIFNGYYLEEKKIIRRMFEEIEGIKLSNVIMPNNLIIKDGILEGYIMDCVNNSISIYDLFSNSRYMDVKKLFTILKKACVALKQIHEKDLICHDLSFDNILVDAKENIFFIDVDSFSYKNYFTTFNPVILLEFLNKTKIKCDNLSQKNIDRLSFLLSFYYLSYFKPIECLSNREYKYLYEEVGTIRNLDYLKKILLSDKIMPDIPYFDEFICNDDNFIIDRNKQIDSSRILFKDYKLY